MSVSESTTPAPSNDFLNYGLDAQEIQNIREQQMEYINLRRDLAIEKASKENESQRNWMVKVAAAKKIEVATSLSREANDQLCELNLMRSRKKMEIEQHASYLKHSLSLRARECLVIVEQLEARRSLAELKDELAGKDAEEILQRQSSKAEVDRLSADA